LLYGRNASIRRTSAAPHREQHSGIRRKTTPEIRQRNHWIPLPRGGCHLEE
jgi:hypothetical protein